MSPKGKGDAPMAARKSNADSLQLISLQSGSNGNCYFVQAGGTRILVDAGISGRQAETRLARYGIDIRSCRALFISHDHSDHARCMGVYHRKYGLPVYVTDATLNHVARQYPDRAGIGDIRRFRAGTTVVLETRDEPLHVHAIRTPHDGADCVAFVFEYRDRRVGLLSDLGHVFPGLPELVLTLDGMLIESNYDPTMLAEGRYPPHLQDRIRGRGGHLSNDEAADLVEEAVRHQRLQWVALGHLSAENNSPVTALRTHRRRLPRSFPIAVADRYGPSGAWEA
ncbi:MAG: MBL fold metallo-hydrolase [Planctomycetota bacterium]|nr:MAG: MBL fold metallo-hydrolase [Planctomycetota bacterium]